MGCQTFREGETWGVGAEGTYNPKASKLEKEVLIDPQKTFN
jgi:hypothetical protein